MILQELKRSLTSIVHPPRRRRSLQHLSTTQVEDLEGRQMLSASVSNVAADVESQRVGLLLPAVQKVRDAAARTQEISDLKNVSENAQIGLLLPAVQKVRAAAGR